MNSYSVTGLVIENNIFAKCDGCITYYNNVNAPTVTVTDNQFWSISSNVLVNSENTNYCTSCSSCTSKSLSSGYCANSDPKFTTLPTQGTAGSGDFNLLPSSPVIGNGANLSSIFTTDINYVTWAIPYGLGAYKYTGTSDITPPAAPSGLAVS